MPSVETLVNAMLPSVSPELLASILDRAAGSPLYAEQLAAMLRERTADQPATLDESAIPANVHALLAARIDALPGILKPVLLDASVIGRTFWSGAVATLGSRDAAAVEPVLADLSRRELARPAFPSSMDGEAEYAFWHALVRDVAYGALPRAARVARHRAAAAWIAERSGGARGRTAEIVAEHYGRALELATALGATPDDLDAIRDPYVDALLGAADHAMGTSPAQAAGHARRALEVVGPRDSRRVEILTTLGLALLSIGHYPEARTALEEVHTRLMKGGGAARAASIAVPLTTALMESGDAARASTILDEARAALANQPGPTLLAVMAEQAMMAVRGEGPRAGEVLARRVVELADELGILPPSRALIALGGDANYARAIEIADAAGDLRTASKCRYNLAVHFRGHADAWLAVINDSIAFDGAHGITNLSPYNVRAWTSFFYLGRSDGSVDELETVIEKAREAGDAFTRSQGMSTLLEIRAARGEPVGSLDELIAEWAAAGLGDGLELLLAEVAIAGGDLAETRSMLAAFLDAGLEPDAPWIFVDHALVAGDRALAARGIAVTRSGAAARQGTSADALALESATDDAISGRLAEADRDLGTAMELYGRAWRRFAEYGWDAPGGTTRGWLGRCLLDDGRPAEAVEHLQAARDIAARLGLAPRLIELDALLASSGVEPAPR